MLTKIVYLQSELVYIMYITILSTSNRIPTRGQ